MPYVNKDSSSSGDGDGDGDDQDEGRKRGKGKGQGTAESVHVTAQSLRAPHLRVLKKRQQADHWNV